MGRHHFEQDVISLQMPNRVRFIEKGESIIVSGKKVVNTTAITAGMLNVLPTVRHHPGLKCLLNKLLL